MSKNKVEDGNEPRLLPVVKLNGHEFLVDIENRQFRNFKNSNEIIGMHSQQGKKMVRDIQGSKWNRHGLFTGTSKQAEV
ncbi:hypothetical protein ACFL5Z_18640 [Planctomycetota bacterium]